MGLVQIAQQTQTYSGGGGLSRVDVSNDNDVNVSLLFTHFDRLESAKQTLTQT